MESSTRFGGEGSADGLLDHYRNPRNLGELPSADSVALVHNPVCGDMLRLALRVREGRIVAVRFKAAGCAAAIAACSAMTELVDGRPVADAARLQESDITALIGELPPMKTHALVLAREGLQRALAGLEGPAEGSA